MNYRQEHNESTWITREGRYQRGRGGIKTTFHAILGFRNPSATFEVAARGIFSTIITEFSASIFVDSISEHRRRSSSRSLAALRYFHVPDKQQGC